MHRAIYSFIPQGLQNYLPGVLLLNSDLGDYQGSAFRAGTQPELLTPRRRGASPWASPPAILRKSLRNRIVEPPT
ncbi:MAG: hypothetical protein H0U97_02460 [Gammaproteobacteria bacterium]|nr:hypothetical protein [Gammaproteobacteria bacterium]